MQEAGVVLSVLRERGRKGLPCTQLYRQMFNRELYLLAYGNIYSNQGAMTPGASAETADGMSEDKIDQIIGLMRQERYRFPPARRVHIPKKNGKLRPLGLPSWSGKLIGEVVRLLLEAYYEPGFSDRSHGFRKGRGCHTALREIRDTWTGATWFIEGDISDCFGSLDQGILLGILAEKIHDQRFLRLIRNMLRAGQRGKPWHRSRLQNLDDYDIVRIYGAEYRGVVNYYLLAQDVWRLSRLQWNALTSMLKTLGAKHGSTVTAMAARHKAKIETSDGLRACFEARKHREGKPDLVARFGGIILRQDRRAVIRDPAPAPALYPRKELIRRLRRRECELCETGATVAVHQVTGLKALGQPGPGQPAWAALMAKMRRKTLIICATCHDWIHANPVAHAV